ncbi:MAG: hypothetical protein EOO38_17955 [Cytophagaceae bacterium]|nr:MAG: hypothetical protein EOO38_17955 [Cytophagaceae bacterium]
MKLFVSKSLILVLLSIAPSVYAQASDGQAEAKKSANESPEGGFGNPVPLENSAPMENSNASDNSSKNASPATNAAPARAPESKPTSEPKANALPIKETAVPAATHPPSAESNAAAANAAAVNEAAANGVMPAHEIKNETSAGEPMTETPAEVDQKVLPSDSWHKVERCASSQTALALDWILEQLCAGDGASCPKSTVTSQIDQKPHHAAQVSCVSIVSAVACSINPLSHRTG